MQALTWRGETKMGEDYAVEEIPAELADQAAEYREKLLENIADFDDSLMEDYLGGEEIAVDRLKAAIRKATIAGQVNPVLTGSAFKNKGVQPMLDAVVDYLPSPLDIEAIVGTALDGETEVLRHADENEPFSALAFKIQTDQHLGKLTYIRVYSGKLDAGSPVLNSTKDRKERIGKIYQMHANKREERAGVGAGEIVAVNGLKQTTTGDTLCDPQKPVILESMTFPAPVISVAIEPKTKGDQEKLGTAIQKLAEEDPTFQVQPGRGDRPDRHLRHGRAPPGDPGRPHAARVQRRGQRRQAAGRLPRDDPQGRRARTTTPTRSRPVGPASSPRCRSPSSRSR